MKVRAKSVSRALACLLFALVLWRKENAATPPTLVLRWSAVLVHGVRDAKMGAPVAARALAIVHTCMYDAWAAYDKRAVGTQLSGALRRPVAEWTLVNKDECGGIRGIPIKDKYNGYPN